MGKTINSTMRKVDKSLTLIANNLISGKYKKDSELRKVTKWLSNAIKTSSNAMDSLSKPLNKGIKGLASLKGKSFDRSAELITQSQLKAMLLLKTVKAEMNDMDEDYEDEEIEDDMSYAMDEEMDESYDEEMGEEDIFDEDVESIRSRARKGASKSLARSKSLRRSTATPHVSNNSTSSLSKVWTFNREV